MTNIILCGGNGTRLWPISRTLMPKQFVKLFDDKSLFQLTLERNKEVCKQQFIVSNAEQYFLAVDQIEEYNQDHSKTNITNSKFLLEPVGRNTAPAIAAAALQSINSSDDAVLLVLSADHVIQDIEAFHQAINIASNQAQEGKLATFGIVPTDANTGYGYINHPRTIMMAHIRSKSLLRSQILKLPSHI